MTRADAGFRLILQRAGDSMPFCGPRRRTVLILTDKQRMFAGRNDTRIFGDLSGSVPKVKKTWLKGRK
ncbi:MAG TPA: hypothetical protein VNT79_16405 [Phycisphaerae bacterium]|nr:hypothetical protein [Phycisphaerae bacterium]